MYLKKKLFLAIGFEKSLLYHKEYIGLLLLTSLDEVQTDCNDVSHT